jgi:hypothetical protein
VRIPLDDAVRKEAELSVWRDPAQCKSELVRAMHDWWCSKGGPDRIPDRSQVDPLELTALLPNVLISEVERNPFRIKYRLVGTLVSEVTGMNITGCYLDELLSADPDQPWIEHYRTVYSTRRPLFGSTTVATAYNGTLSYEFGIFPLRRGGGDIEQFIAVEDYFGRTSIVEQLQPWRNGTK